MQANSGLAVLIAAVLIGSVGVIAAVLFYYRFTRLRGEYERAKETFARNQSIVESSGEGVLELDQTGHVRFANPAAARMSGYEPEDLIGRNYLELMTSGLEDTNRPGLGRLGYTTDMMRGVGAVLRCKNGRPRPVEYKMVPIRNGNGANVGGAVMAFRDLTDRVRADLMLADMQYTAQVGAWELIVETGLFNVTEVVSTRLGLSSSRGIPTERVLGLFLPEDLTRIDEIMHLAIVEGRSFDLELRAVAQDETWVRCIGKAERVDGRTIRLYGAIQDVTERKLAERTLRETRDFFSATLDAMPSLVMHVDEERRVTYCNRSPLRSLVVSKEPPAGERIDAVLGASHYADMQTNIEAALADHACTEVRALLRDGQTRDVQASFIPEKQEGRAGTGCFIILTDVTELKNLEARLRQAEKMQVIGQLTGGVAHDFNNLLGVIIGNLQLMERDVGKDAVLSKKLATAMRAALRGGDLTRRLLAFARRQILDPSIVSLKRQLSSFNDLVQRTLGESIETRLVLAPDLWHVRIDPGQLESAILNLAINARDAMPNGGRLTIEARNVHSHGGLQRGDGDLEPGEYVVISVTDTGTGIAPEALARVFEPFFTTKESGRGSGLGLSIVQGFAKQSGGTATITSDLGRGTTVSLYLPRSLEAQSTVEDTIVHKKMPGGDESILVVEDDTDLRSTVVLALQRLGYRTFEASNGEAALRALQGTEHIDMLFTDVMMPGGMLGTALAQRARQLNPKIRVLLTTGYADDPTLVNQIYADDVMAKPYRNEDLALKIRQLLDREVHFA